MEFGNGFSAQNLANMRQFFITYSSNQPISQTLSAESPLIPQTVSDQLHFTLSWLHYLKLMRIENLEMIHDYTINDITDMYMKTAFPIHENGDMYIKTQKHIHVRHHI